MLQRHFTELPPLALYVHIPWCIKKCPYCDFNSHEQKQALPEDEYIEAVLKDLAAEMPRVWGRTLSSVFIGGGTPSLFSARALDNLLSGIRALTALPPSAEITMEANPGTFEQEKFKDFFSLGINRLSIGVQSFRDEQLKALGRVHNANEATRAVDIAKNAGFEDINLDLMFGLPGQSEADALSDVQTAIGLEPTHISYYELTLEPNTLFAKHPPTLPVDDIRWQMHNRGIALLEDQGFARYEVSAFAKPGKRSVHNSNYWLFGDYLGIGAGAHSKVSFANTNEIVRRWKLKHPTQYLKAAKENAEQCIGGEHTITAEDTAIEFMMNAMRLSDGFPVTVFEQHTGLPLQHWQPAIDEAVGKGLLTQSGMQLHATEQGFNFLNDLLALFMPEQAKTLTYPIIPLRSE